MERIPIRRAKQLDDLDPNEVIEGYRSGFAGAPEPGHNHSFSFWHGWRNGMIDTGRSKPDRASADLARDVIETGYLTSLFTAA